MRPLSSLAPATLPARADTSTRAGLAPWLQLVLGFALILLFIFGLGNASLYLPGARHMAEVIDERQLRATAIYYTDFEESAEGSESIRHSLEYRPRGK